MYFKYSLRIILYNEQRENEKVRKRERETGDEETMFPPKSLSS